MIEEVACHGEVGLSSDEAKPGDSLKILGWHNKFKDERDTFALPAGCLAPRMKTLFPSIQSSAYTLATGQKKLPKTMR